MEIKSSDPKRFRMMEIRTKELSIWNTHLRNKEQRSGATHPIHFNSITNICAFVIYFANVICAASLPVRWFFSRSAINLTLLLTLFGLAFGFKSTNQLGQQRNNDHTWNKSLLTFRAGQRRRRKTEESEILISSFTPLLKWFFNNHWSSTVTSGAFKVWNRFMGIIYHCTDYLLANLNQTLVV